MAECLRAGLQPQSGELESHSVLQSINREIVEIGAQLRGLKEWQQKASPLWPRYQALRKRRSLYQNPNYDRR